MRVERSEERMRFEWSEERDQLELTELINVLSLSYTPINYATITELYHKLLPFRPWRALSSPEA